MGKFNYFLPPQTQERETKWIAVIFSFKLKMIHLLLQKELMQFY